jgi:hypothetical protein
MMSELTKDGKCKRGYSGSSKTVAEYAQSWQGGAVAPSALRQQRLTFGTAAVLQFVAPGRASRADLDAIITLWIGTQTAIIQHDRQNRRVGRE